MWAKTKEEIFQDKPTILSLIQEDKVTLTFHTDRSNMNDFIEKKYLLSSSSSFCLVHGYTYVWTSNRLQLLMGM